MCQKRPLERFSHGRKYLLDGSPGKSRASAQSSIVDSTQTEQGDLEQTQQTYLLDGSPGKRCERFVPSQVAKDAMRRKGLARSRRGENPEPQLPRDLPANQTGGISGGAGFPGRERERSARKKITRGFRQRIVPSGRHVRGKAAKPHCERQGTHALAQLYIARWDPVDPFSSAGGKRTRARFKGQLRALSVSLDLG